MVDAGTVSSVPGAGFKQRALGVGLVVLSTIAIAIVPSFAKLAYEGGSNTLSVITGRSIFSVLMTLALLVAFRQPMVIPRRPMRIAPWRSPLVFSSCSALIANPRQSCASSAQSDSFTTRFTSRDRS